MFFQIELLYFIVMIGVFILLVVKKTPAGLALIISSIIGALLSAIISKTEFQLRHFVEGGVAYFNPILLVTCAMIFMVVLQESGALDYISVKIVRVFRKVPSLMLISFMLIIMLPGMITGSTLASVISAGALVGPIMIKLGIPKHKTGAIIAFGAIMGEIAPPVNIPAMLICEAVDMPYRGFMLPLLLLTIPLAIFAVLVLGRKHVKAMSLEEVEELIDHSILKETKWYVTIPILLLLVIILLQSIFPKVFGIFGMPIGFIIAAIPGLFLGRKIKILETLTTGIEKALPAMLLLVGVGVFVQTIALNGVRAYFVMNVLNLPSFLQYLGMAIFVPLLGGVSAFASASVFGAPFVMASLDLNIVYVISGISMLAALGEFLPPTATAAAFTSEVIEEEKYLRITKAAYVPMLVAIIYAMIFVVKPWVGILLWPAIVLTAVVLFIIRRVKSKKQKKTEENELAGEEL